MIDNDKKKEALKFLAQKYESSPEIWISPAEAEPAGSARVANTESPAVEYISETSKENLESVPGSGIQAMPTTSAPEPEPTIPLPGQIEDAFPAYKDINSFNNAVKNCLRCPLGKTRTKFVFGVGDPNADLVLIGEAPGADEDKQGEPFVGRAGKLLDKILEAINMKRGENVYIGNILKCRPPDNRDPKPDEVERCEPYLVKQLQLIQPKLIVALGRISAQTLLRTTQSLTKLRGDIHDYHGIPFLVTYHPAALLRNPHWKRPAWEDFQKVQSMMENG